MTGFLTWIDDLGSYALDETNGMSILEDAAGWNMPPVELTTAGYVAADGSSLSNTRYGARTLDLPVEFFDATRARTSINNLASRLRRGPAIIRYTDDLRTRDLNNVVFGGGLMGSELCINEERMDVLTLIALDPWWHGADQTVLLDFGAEVPFSDGTVSFSSALTPFDGGSTTAININGDAPAYPVLTLTGPMDAGAVVVPESSGGIQLAQALGSGEVLTIDTRPGRRGPSWQAGQIDWSWLTPDSRLFTLPLGASAVAVGVSGDSGTTSFEMTYSERWLTP